MKVKEVARTANVAWSPSPVYPIYLATATAAQQLDATFSTSAAVELFELGLGDKSQEMRNVGSLTTDCRFHKLVWGPWGMEGPLPSGCLVGGAENGSVYVWNPANSVAGRGEDPLVAKLEKHVGGVAALDINPFQRNLLATGASDSEIYIWDLNNTENPMTPGAKSQPPDDVSCLAWNRQVQHILASTYAGRCVVWDLRKNEPIIKVSDSMARIKCKLLAWHPDVATQMCLASDDDHTPVIQMWDLRFATAPLKSLESHQRGLLSVAWHPADPDLLLSCGRDDRILCWNPNSNVQGGEVVYELQTSNQWCFDVQWCPRNPAVLSSCSYDGHISVYSLMGGPTEAQAPAPSLPTDISAFSDDPFSMVTQKQARSQSQLHMPLKKAPKWLRRPVGASFAFGGKLITFEGAKSGEATSTNVHLSQVVTETELLARSSQLESALASDDLSVFCDGKVMAAQGNPTEENIWKFMKVQFASDPRAHYLQLLGYDKARLANKVQANLPAVAPAVVAEPVAPSPDPVAPSPDPIPDVVENLIELSTDSPPPLAVPTDSDIQLLATFTEVSPDEAECDTIVPPSIPSEFDAIVQSSIPSEFDAIVQPSEFDTIVQPSEFDTIVQPSTPSEFDAIVQPSIASATSSPPPMLSPAVPSPAPSPLTISSNDSLDGIVTAALLLADFDTAVDTCLAHGKMAEAIILAIAGGNDLLLRTQQHFFETNRSSLSKFISLLVTRDFEAIIRTCDLDNWQEALGVALTYAQADEFASLCDLLGARLETERGGALAANACLCYICAGNVDRLVACWLATTTALSAHSIQDLVEKVMVLQRAVRQASGRAAPPTSAPLAATLSQYAALLAAQGALTTAAHYLAAENDAGTETSVALLRDRLCVALGQQSTPPFDVKDLSPGPAPAPPAVQPKQHVAAAVVAGLSDLAHMAPTPPAGLYGSTPVPAAAAPATYPTSTHFAGQPTFAAPAPPAATPYMQPAAVPPAPHAAPTPAVSRQPAPPTPVATSAVPSYARSGLTGKYPAYSQSNAGMDPFSAAQQAVYSGYGGAAPVTSQPPPQHLHATHPAVNQSGYDAMNGSCHSPGSPYMPASHAPPPGVAPLQSSQPSYQERAPHVAWNDPPVVAASKKKEPKKYEAPAPITAPIYGQPQPEQAPPGAPNFAAPPTYAPHQQYAPPQQTAVPPPAEPPKPVDKAPIPAEHQALSTTLSRLVEVCQASARSPLMRKKLDDVLKKLEILDDKLRQGMLSAPVLRGLHQLVGFVAVSDYSSSLACHTHLIQAANFSEMSAFMPAVKTLLQTAAQLQVHV